MLKKYVNFEEFTCVFVATTIKCRLINDGLRLLSFVVDVVPGCTKCYTVHGCVNLHEGRILLLLSGLWCMIGMLL